MQFLGKKNNKEMQTPKPHPTIHTSFLIIQVLPVFVYVHVYE